VKYKIPSFGYPGGKVKLRKWLVNRMPLRGRKYVEPFAGRGAVFWLAVHMLAFEEWHLNDPWTARWFDAIQRVDLNALPERLSEVLMRFYLRRCLDPKTRVNDDVAVAIEDRTMYSGGSPSPSNNWKIRPSLAGLKRGIIRARAVLKSIRPTITALEWDKCGLENLSEEDFVYLDPPYDTAGVCYAYDTLIHADLLRYLLEAPHLWMLSGYSSPLYLRYLGKPHGIKMHRMFMQQHEKGEKAIMRRECIWTNYTLGDDGSVRRKVLRAPRIRKKRMGV